MPKSLTSGNLARGQFDKHDFLYLAQDDEYPCPAGARAIWRYSTVEEMMRIRRRTVEHPFGTLKHGMGWTHYPKIMPLISVCTGRTR